MPQKLVWTGPADARLKRLRSEGQSWDRISVELGISRNAAIERGRRIGARLPPPEHKPDLDDPDRSPMAPGHWISWGVMTAGTCLANEPYVYQNPSLRRHCVAASRAESHAAPSIEVKAARLWNKS